MRLRSYLFAPFLALAVFFCSAAWSAGGGPEQGLWVTIGAVDIGVPAFDFGKLDLIDVDHLAGVEPGVRRDSRRDKVQHVTQIPATQLTPELVHTNRTRGLGA